MKKRLLSAILSLCMLLTMAPTVAFAAEPITGSCGDNLTWSLDSTTGTLTISGTGSMANYAPDCQPWKDNMDNIKTVVIENGVERIGQRAFQSAKNLKELTLNGNVIIGDRAFHGVALEKINGQEYITKIEGRAFKNLNVKTLDLSNVTEIGEYAFEAASGLKEITVSDKLLKIKNYAFMQSGLTKIELPDQVDITDSTALFYSCKDLESVHLPNTLTNIPAQMFQFSDKLKTVNIPSTVTMIGTHAFNSAAVNAFLLPNLTEVGDDAFINLVMGSGIYVPNASTADLFTSEKYSSDKSFIAVTNGGTFPDDTVFEAGKLATPVKEGSIFSGWYKISDFSGSPATDATAGQTYYAKWAPASGTCGAAGNENNVTWKLTANADDPSTYTLTIAGTGAMASWKDSASDSSPVRSDRPWAFASNLISKVVVGNDITNIGENAFFGLTALKNATMGQNIKTIERNAFRRCTSLTAFTIPDSVTSIGYNALCECVNIAQLNIGSGLTDLGAGCLLDCGQGSNPVPNTALGKVVIPANIKKISGGSFRNCTNAVLVIKGKEVSAVGTPVGISGVKAVDATTCTSFTFNGQNYGTAVVYVKNSSVIKGLDGKNYNLKIAVTNGGTFAQDTTFTAETLNKPTKSGYKFEGWYTDTDFQNAAPTVEAGHTYYAKWTEKATPEIAIKATPDTLTGGGSVELTVTGVPSEGTVEVTCDNGISVTATETAGKYTAQLPNATKDYIFTAKYTGTKNYNDVEKSCKVSVTHKSSSSSGGSSSSSTPTNTVSASTASNGKVSLDKSTAKKGDTVTVTVAPDAGYQLDKLTATDAKGNTIAVAKKGDNQFTFTMSDSKVTITPTFSKIEDTKPSKNGFVDVASSAWHADAVQYVTDKGLMNGTGDNQFSPNASTTRGMLMTVLARYAGADTTGGATWYEKGMNWAKANGVSDGTNPNANITREQLVTMLYRYAGSPAANGSLNSFSDAASVNSYAVNAMQWAVANGIVNGSNSKLNPQDNATRAQVAAILMRFCEMSK